MNMAMERKEAPGVTIEDVKKVVDPMMTAFEEFKKANDLRLKEIAEKGSPDPVTLEKLAKIEKEFAKSDDINQKLTLAAAEQKKRADEITELKETVEKLELKLKRPGFAVVSTEERKAALKKAVNDWGRAVIGAYTMGENNLTADQQKMLADVAAEYKALGVSTDTTGGYLAPSEFVAEIIRGVTEMSPARSLVRVRTIGGKSLITGKRTGQFAARRTTEQGTRSETDGLRFGQVEINAPETYAMIDISQQNLEDSAFDLENELNFEATEQFAVQEGQEFCTGTGVGQCEGILTNTGVGTFNSGSAATVADVNGQADGIIKMKHAIKTAYTRNANWLLNRTVLGSVRTLKDGNKQYIWMPGLALGKPNTIDGDPYVEMPDMPLEGAGNTPIAYGDFQRAYTMVDRVGMTMLRDPYTQAASGNIRFWFRRRFGGQVVLAEAIIKLVCHT